MGSFNSYKYNGKELQETGMFDYGWRQYMPDLGRWNGIDLLSENYNDSTPYGYVLNNPIFNFDPNGMLSQQFIDSIHNSSSGTTWFNTGIGFTSNGGQSMDYDGNNINWSNETTGNLLSGVGAELGALYFNVPVDITVPKGNSRTWNDRLNNGIDSYVMYSKFTSALWNSRLNYNRSVLANAIENTKVGQSVSAAENFMFLELPASLAGGELLAAGWRAAGIGKLICGPAGRLTGGLVKICFTEGTLVAIEKGSKKIEDIQEGDLVWSYNEETGKKELKKVVELSRNTSSSLVKIAVNGTEITCTPEHPFYVNGSWIEAKNLTKGMLLTTLDGKTSPVESIKFLDEKVKVYNFEVEGNHNYYVSEKGILVHNNCEYTTEFIKGFYVRGMTTIENGVYNRTVQGLANYEGKSLFELVKAFEGQAKAAGADKVVIKGIDIVETRLMNSRAAEILGYTYKELSKNSIELVKFLK